MKRYYSKIGRRYETIIVLLIAAVLGAELQEQLGLKLEPQKAAIEMVVIDHAEKPSEN